MSSHDGLQNKVAAIVIAGNPSGAHVVLDSAGLRAYDETGHVVWEVKTDLIAGTFGQMLMYTSGAGYQQSIVASPNGQFEVPVIMSSQTFDAEVPLVQFWSNLTKWGTVTRPVSLGNGNDTVSGLQLSIPGGLIANNRSNAGTVAGVGPTKDGGCGDIQFTVQPFRRYSVSYTARAQSTVAGDSISFQIRDSGSAASPVAADPVIAASQTTVSAAGGAGNEVYVTRFFDIGMLASGTHTIAPFYARTAGGGNVSASQTLERQFRLYDEG